MRSRRNQLRFGRDIEDEEADYWLDAAGNLTSDPTLVVPPSSRFPGPSADTKPVSVFPIEAQIAPFSAKANTLAILALVFGVTGSSIIPIVLGHIALAQIRQSVERGSGIAIAGLILGYLGIAAVAIVLILVAVSSAAATR